MYVKGGKKLIENSKYLKKKLEAINIKNWNNSLLKIIMNPTHFSKMFMSSLKYLGLN